MVQKTAVFPGSFDNFIKKIFLGLLPKIKSRKAEMNSALLRFAAAPSWLRMDLIKKSI